MGEERIKTEYFYNVERATAKFLVHEMDALC